MTAPAPLEELAKAEVLALLDEIEQQRIFGTLTEEQAAALTFEWEFWARPDQIPPPGDWGTWFVMEGRGTGKLLDLDTPIPTPAGWRLLRHLALGDELFDEAGRPCRITATFDEWPERAWSLGFSDGSTIVAGGEHQWTTWTVADRVAYNRSAYEDHAALPDDWPTWRSLQGPKSTRPLTVAQAHALDLIAAGRRWTEASRLSGVPRGSLGALIRRAATSPAPPRRTDRSMGPAVRTTDQIVASLTTGGRGDLNHSIPVARPLQLPEADLPVDPYVLGYWLGDGTSSCSDLTIGDEDAEETLGRMRAAGYSTGRGRPSHHGAACATYPIGVKVATGRNLPATLRAMGLKGNKHIPDAYLWASESQRLALLRGLMDSDGCVSSSSVEFTSTNERLADGVAQLARSLGAKATIGKGRSTLYGVDKGPKWRVCWRPTFHVPFLLRRKAEAIPPVGAQASRLYHRMIVSATPVPVRPMRCLTVDSPNSLFLVGESMIPTHNTRTGTEWVRKKGPANREGVLIGANPRDVRDLMIEGRSGILQRSPKDERPKYEPSKLKLTWPNGAVAHIRSAEDPESVRGLSADWAWCDEIAKWRFIQETWDMLRFALREGRNPQTLVTTTPKPLPLIRQLHEGRFPRLVRSPPISTFRNRANLAEDFLTEMQMTFAGTRLGAQELYAAMLTDVEGALWSWALIEAARWDGRWTETSSGLMVPGLPEMKRKVCAVDPSGSSQGAETGIVVVGIDTGRPPVAYVLDDRSVRGSPYDWGRAALRAYIDNECNVMIGETNYGGEMVEHTIKTMPAERDEKTGKEYPSGDYVRFDTVRAGIGKKLRAEPAVALYEQTSRGFRRVYHVGTFGDLESQLTTWVPGETSTSPDRLDALVWGINYLIGGKTYRGRQQTNTSALTSIIS